MFESASRQSRRRQGEPIVVVWWGALGLGMGLLLLALLVGWQQERRARESNPLVAQAQQMQPLLKALQDGQPLSAEVVQIGQGTVLVPLVQALVDAQRQRQQALRAYQTQVETISLGSALTPPNLVNPKGRALVRARLDELRSSLDGLVRRDAVVQTRLDEALQQWANQIPGPSDARWRHELVASTGSTARAMSTFFRTEQDIVLKVDTLLARLDAVGAGVTLETQGVPDLIFAKKEDLAFYQASLKDLNDLGEQEQRWLVAAEQASGLHAQKVGDLIMATLGAAD
jgi:hypothetical protein